MGQSVFFKLSHWLVSGYLAVTFSPSQILAAQDSGIRSALASDSGTGGIGIVRGIEQRPSSAFGLPTIIVNTDGFTIKSANGRELTYPTGNLMADRFLAVWWDLHNPDNGYFSERDIPFHSAETLLVEAPDYGHLTTSEGFSYWVWLEAMLGKYTGDFSLMEYAINQVEKYAIPQFQPTNASYRPQSPATFARENPSPEQYPSPLESGVRVGQDPIGSELQFLYGPQIYGMHWLLDTRNWYQFGKGFEPTFINTFQRGPQESVWETIPHPSIEEFKYGAPSQGYLSLFTSDPNGYKKQWRYTNAPDADARLIQAVLWAQIYAQENGYVTDFSAVFRKASKMGDFLRYSFFDKYFKKIGCRSLDCPAGQGYESAHYLLSWYYSWGGSSPEESGSWAWRIGSSQAHFGYQNPVAAYALAQIEKLRPASANGKRDWDISLKRQIEFYRWLQSVDGAIAGGASNSVDGRYNAPAPGQAEFYGLSYDPNPVYADPGSNSWFGWQAWSMQRVAEYYELTGDKQVEDLLGRWTKWASNSIQFGENGQFLIPVGLEWEGQPETWNPNNPLINSKLRVRITDYNQDVGIAAALAKTLYIYAKASQKWLNQSHPDLEANAQELLDRIWTAGRDSKGLSFPEVRKDYSRFLEPVYVPQTYLGKMPAGSTINKNSNFLSLRPQYRQDADFAKIDNYLQGGEAPVFRYHRFWAQVEAALAFAEFDRLTP